MMTRIIGLVLSGVMSGVATQVAAAPLENDAATQLLNRLNQLEQEVSTLRGQNQELHHQVESLQKNQKDGFLQVDERVQKLEVPADKQSASADKVGYTRPASTGNQDKSNTDTTSASADSVGVASVEKVSPDSPDSYYYYGSDKSTETAADKPLRPATQPAATSLRSSDVTPSESLLPTGTPDKTDAAAGQVYNAAYKLLLERPDESVRAFEDFLRSYPTHPLAPNAQYWLGEALYSQKSYARATEEFLKVLQRYKTSAKAPDAALKLGYAFYEMQSWDLARSSLEDAVQSFPDSSVSRLAQARLEQMTTEGH